MNIDKLQTQAATAPNLVLRAVRHHRLANAIARRALASRSPREIAALASRFDWALHVATTVERVLCRTSQPIN